MIDFLTIVLLVFGVLQIILFFKMWGMTNDVDKIKRKLEAQPKEEDAIIIEAQIEALDGDKEKAFDLYQKAFYLNVIELYNKSINEYGDGEGDYQDRNNYYEIQYSSIVKYYLKRISKLEGMNLNQERFDSYKKVNQLICKQ